MFVVPERKGLAAPALCRPRPRHTSCLPTPCRTYGTCVQLEKSMTIGNNSCPRLVVEQGLHPGLEYPIKEGVNWVGRSDKRAADIDLEGQEFGDETMISREHARITLEE